MRFRRWLVSCLFLVACGSGESGLVEEEACLDVDPAESCPGTDGAENVLLGSTTCADPMMEITAVGELLTDELESRSGDNTLLGTEDTGAPVEVRECCYQATWAPTDETCII